MLAAFHVSVLIIITDTVYIINIALVAPGYIVNMSTSCIITLKMESAQLHDMCMHAKPYVCFSS